MPTDNYVKPLAFQFNPYFFDSTDEDSMNAAVAKARKASKSGYIVFFKPLAEMPHWSQCVGHSPYEAITCESGIVFREERCKNCNSMKLRDDNE
jgi:hypothetical protein